VAKNTELINKIKDILLKKAEGFYYREETFEYIKKQNKEESQMSLFDIKQREEEDVQSEEEGGLILAKKKVTSHFVPPDMLAIKILLENFGEKIDEDKFSAMSDSELIKLANSLSREIKNISKEGEDES